jgi:hypothetical protein
MSGSSRLDLEPRPIQEHAAPQPSAYQQGRVKPAVSYLSPLPWSWKGDVPPLKPARQLSVRCRYTTGALLSRQVREVTDHHGALDGFR